MKSQISYQIVTNYQYDLYNIRRVFVSVQIKPSRQQQFVLSTKHLILERFSAILPVFLVSVISSNTVRGIFLVFLCVLF